MDKQEIRYRKIEITIRILSTIGACLAFFITIHLEVRHLVQQQNHEQQLEFKKALLTEQLSAYKNACHMAGEIVNMAETKSVDFSKYVNEFEVLYWGEMGLSEDSSVVTAGKKFRYACKDFEFSDKSINEITKLKKLALAFAEACKKSTAKDWQKLLAQ